MGDGLGVGLWACMGFKDSGIGSGIGLRAYKFPSKECRPFHPKSST